MSLSPKPTAQLSLKRQLLLWLLLPQLLLWLVGGTLAYRIALSYAEKGIDQSLLQSVRSLARQVKPIGSGLLIDFPTAAQAIIEEDPQDKVSYMVSSPPGKFVLGNFSLPEPPSSIVKGLKRTGEPLLYQASVTPSVGPSQSQSREASRNLRIAALELQFGDDAAPQRMRVQVAKSLAVQERIARELVSDMLVPLILLGLVLGGLVYAGIRRGLQPLSRLQDKLQAQSSVQTGAATSFSPIALQQAPQEVHSLAGALNQLLAAVERSVSQEKRFINDAAHQLRTPLAGLKAQLDVALQETDPQARQARLLKVNAGVERANHLVHQLLQLARSESNVAMQRLDVLPLAKSLAQEMAPAALAAGIDFGYEGTADEAPLMIQGQGLLLREALTNLIDNAVRYAGRGATVTLRVKRVEAWNHLADDLSSQAMVAIEVEDNGSGVAEVELPRIFERFYRVNETPGGAGLGLAIVREIAQRHSGQIKATSAQPHGLRMTVLLPLTD